MTYKQDDCTKLFLKSFYGALKKGYDSFDRTQKSFIQN